MGSSGPEFPTIKQNFMVIDVKVDKISQFLAILDEGEPIVLSRTASSYEVHVRPAIMTAEFIESIEGLLVFEEKDYLMDCPDVDNNIDL